MRSPLQFFTSFSGKLSAILLIVLFVIMLVISTSWYVVAKGKALDTFNQSIDKTELMLHQSLIWVDRGTSVRETQYDQTLRRAIQIFQLAYQEADGEISRMNLTKVKEDIALEFSGTFDLYLINEDGVIIYTTFPEELNLDFSKYPEFFQKITDIRLSGQLLINRTVMGFAPNSPDRKFAYQGTPDKRYLLEVSKNLEPFRPKESNVSFEEIIDASYQLNPSILFMEFINSQKTVLASYSWRNDDIEQIDPKIVQTVLHTQENNISYDTKNQQLTVYLFLPDYGRETPSSRVMNLVARIVYSTAEKDIQILYLTYIYLLFNVFTTCIILIFAFTAARHFTRPLNHIIEDINKIASGDLNHNIRPTGSFELRQIEQSINIMVQRLKNNIEDIKATEEELRQELIMREKAEEKFRHLFESAHDAIFILEEGIIRQCNREARKLVGGKLLDIIGVSFLAFSPLLQPDGTTSFDKLQFIFSILQREVVTPFEWQFMKTDKTLVYTEGHLNTISIGGSRLIQASFRDITELKKSRDREVVALRQIEENLTHLAVINDQIRNPLSIIASVSEMHGGEFEDTISVQVDRIDKMIDQVDKQFISTNKVRIFLKKHFGLEDPGDPSKKRNER